MSKSQTRPALNVLAFEEHALILETLQLVLGEAGYSVSGASTEHEALSLLDTQNFDAAVINMRPAADGHSLPLAAALTLRKIPFVFCTAFPTGIAQAYLDIPVIEKPFLPEQLLEAVAQVLLPR